MGTTSTTKSFQRLKLVMWVRVVTLDHRDASAADRFALEWGPFQKMKQTVQCRHVQHCGSHFTDYKEKWRTPRDVYYFI